MGNVIEIRRRTRVLLVEDEPLISEIAVEALEEQGFVVEVVTNALDALRRLASGRTIDILFTDINLAGGVDGATLARRARQLLPDLPVIYTSGRCAMDRRSGSRAPCSCPSRTMHSASAAAEPADRGKAHTARSVCVSG